MRLIRQRCAGRLCALEQGVDVSFGTNDVADAEPARCRRLDRDVRILRQRRRGRLTLGVLLSSTVVREGSGQLVLREVEDRDLSVLFEHSTDRDAIRMAAFTSPDPDDRSSFDRRWARLKSDDSTTNRVVEIDGRVVGHIASFDLEGHREVTYWIGREDWGRGLATRALQEFLRVEATRPLCARAASDNAASIRVLTKCGFRIVGEGREFAHGRNEETDEVVLRLDA
jgi:RimJ/RimL family protein N-acetyltransferase